MCTVQDIERLGDQCHRICSMLLFVAYEIVEYKNFDLDVAVDDFHFVDTA